LVPLASGPILNLRGIVLINTIVLTVHNKKSTVEKILDQLLKTTSSFTQKIIVVDDGSTDGTTTILKQYANKNVNIQYRYTPDLWEVLANCDGLENVETPYATIIQDDMLIHERHWDRILLNAAVCHNAFSVSGRAGTDISFNHNDLYLFNHIGCEYPLGQTLLGRIVAKLLTIVPSPYRSAYSVKIARPFGAQKRQVINRGPLVINMEAYNKLGGLDKKFAPFELDDIDLCLRATKEDYGGHYVLPIHYTEVNGSKKSNTYSAKMSIESISKNKIRILQKHRGSILKKKFKDKYRV